MYCWGIFPLSAGCALIRPIFCCCYGWAGMQQQSSWPSCISFPSWWMMINAQQPASHTHNPHTLLMLWTKYLIFHLQTWVKLAYCLCMRTWGTSGSIRPHVGKSWRQVWLSLYLLSMHRHWKCVNWRFEFLWFLDSFHSYSLPQLLLINPSLRMHPVQPIWQLKSVKQK